MCNIDYHTHMNTHLYIYREKVTQRQRMKEITHVLCLPWVPVNNSNFEDLISNAKIDPNFIEIMVEDLL